MSYFTYSLRAREQNLQLEVSNVEEETCFISCYSLPQGNVPMDGGGGGGRGRKLRAIPCPTVAGRIQKAY